MCDVWLDQCVKLSRNLRASFAVGSSIEHGFLLRGCQEVGIIGDRVEFCVCKTRYGLGFLV